MVVLFPPVTHTDDTGAVTGARADRVTGEDTDTDEDTDRGRDGARDTLPVL